MCLALYIVCFSFSSLCSVFMDPVLFMRLLYGFWCNMWSIMKHHRHSEAVWIERVFPAWASDLGGHSACTFKQYEQMPISSFKFSLSVLGSWGTQNKKGSMKNKAKNERKVTSSLSIHNKVSLSEPVILQTIIPADVGTCCWAGFIPLLALKSQELKESQTQGSLRCCLILFCSHINCSFLFRL